MFLCEKLLCGFGRVPSCMSFFFFVKVCCVVFVGCRPVSCSDGGVCRAITQACCCCCPLQRTPRRVQLSIKTRGFCWSGVCVNGSQPIKPVNEEGSFVLVLPNRRSCTGELRFFVRTRVAVNKELKPARPVRALFLFRCSPIFHFIFHLSDLSVSCL